MSSRQICVSRDTVFSHAIGAWIDSIDKGYGGVVFGQAIIQLFNLTGCQSLAQIAISRSKLVTGRDITPQEHVAFGRAFIAVMAGKITDPSRDKISIWLRSIGAVGQDPVLPAVPHVNVIEYEQTMKSLGIFIQLRNRLSCTSKDVVYFGWNMNPFYVSYLEYAHGSRFKAAVIGVDLCTNFSEACATVAPLQHSHKDAKRILDQLRSEYVNPEYLTLGGHPVSAVLKLSSNEFMTTLGWKTISAQSTSGMRPDGLGARMSNNLTVQTSTAEFLEMVDHTQRNRTAEVMIDMVGGSQNIHPDDRPIESDDDDSIKVIEPKGLPLPFSKAQTTTSMRGTFPPEYENSSNSDVDGAEVHEKPTPRKAGKKSARQEDVVGTPASIAATPEIQVTESLGTPATGSPKAMSPLSKKEKAIAAADAKKKKASAAAQAKKNKD